MFYYVFITWDVSVHTRVFLHKFFFLLSLFLFFFSSSFHFPLFIDDNLLYAKASYVHWIRKEKVFLSNSYCLIVLATYFKLFTRTWRVLHWFITCVAIHNSCNQLGDFLFSFFFFFSVSFFFSFIFWCSQCFYYFSLIIRYSTSSTEHWIYILKVSQSRKYCINVLTTIQNFTTVQNIVQLCFKTYCVRFFA